MERTYDVNKTSWTSYVRSIYVLYLRGISLQIEITEIINWIKRSKKSCRQKKLELGKGNLLTDAGDRKNEFFQKTKK